MLPPLVLQRPPNFPLRHLPYFLSSMSDLLLFLRNCRKRRSTPLDSPLSYYSIRSLSFPPFSHGTVCIGLLFLRTELQFATRHRLAYFRVSNSKTRKGIIFASFSLVYLPRYDFFIALITAVRFWERACRILFLESSHNSFK